MVRGIPNPPGPASGQTAEGYAQAGQSLQGLSAQTGQMDAANRQNIEDAGRKDAQVRGVEYSPQGSMDATNAAAARQNLLTTMQGVTQGQGANVNAYGNARIGAAHQQQGEEK